MGKALEISDLTVRYAAVEALHEVSLRVDPSEIVAVVGRNGAGKTTLLRTIFGFVRPAAGTILYGDVNLGGEPTHRMPRLGLAYVPEYRGVLQELTVLENLRLAALGARRRESEPLEEVFELFPMLRERMKDRAGTLSGGQQQMLALGRALMAKPDLLLLDEPSLGLSPKVVDVVFNTLGELSRKGIAILLIEQNVQRALSIASRGCLLHLGRVAIEASSSEILDDPRLFSMYMGKREEMA